MHLETRKVGKVLVVDCLDKSLDAKMAVDFKSAMAELIDQDNRRIVLNLKNVAFIDSSGLGAIVSSMKRLGRDGDLIIAGARESTIRLFKLTRMDRLFKMYETEEKALTDIGET